MARFIGPTQKIKRKFGMLPESPAQLRSTRKLSDYGLRLREKQKLKFIYGVLERQFKKYFDQASKNPKNTGLVLLQILEGRLDNVLYRLGLVKTRPQARQLVNHGHVRVNGKKVDIPSYSVKVGEVIELKPASQNLDFIKEALKERKEQDLPTWLESKGAVGQVKRLPERTEIPFDIDENLVIEYYSR